MSQLHPEQQIEQETCADPADTSLLEKGKSSLMTPNEVSGYSDASTYNGSSGGTPRICSNKRATKAEEKVKEMEDRIELAKTEIGKLLDRKDNAIQ